MIEVFIPGVEQVATAKEFIIHCLVLDLNHLDRVCEGLRSKHFLNCFFNINLSSSMVLYFFVICYIRTNFASRWKIWFEFWKRVEAKIASFFLLCFRWLFRLFHHCQNIVYSKFYIGVSKFCLGFYMLTGAKSCMFLLFYNFLIYL